MIHDGNKDKVKENKWNVTKFSMVSKIINEVKLFQKIEYELLPLQVIQQYLEDLAILNEDELDAESLLREPRK